MGPVASAQALRLAQLVGDPKWDFLFDEADANITRVLGELAHAIARLREVLDAEPEALVVTLGTPADDSARKWDVSVVIRCADLADLAAEVPG